MIAASEIMELVLEPDDEKQSKLVDALTATDAKAVLAVCLRIIREEIRK